MRTLSTGKPVRVGEFTLVPVEQCVIDIDCGGAGGWLSAFKHAIALLVYDGTETRLLALEPGEIALDSLLEKVPDLGGLMSELSG